MGVFDEIKQQEQQNLNTSDQVNDQVSDQAAAPVLTENVFAPVATDNQTMKDDQIQAFSRDWRQQSNDDLDQDIAAGFIKREDADPVRWKSAIETAKGLGYDEKSYDLIYDDLPEYQKQWKEKELRRYCDNCDTMKNMCITDKNFLNTLDDKTAKDLYDINFNLAVYGQPNEPNAVWAFGQRVAYQTGRSEKSIQTGKLAGNIRGKRGDERAAAIAAWRKEHDQLVRMPEIDTSGYGVEDFVMAAADQLPIMARTTGAVVGGTLAGGAAGAGVGSAVPVVGTAAGGVAGAKAGWVAGNALAAYESYQIEVNSMTESLLDITDKDGLPLEDWVVDGASYAYGAIAAAIELVPMKAVTNTIPGMKNITKVGIKQALKEAVKDKTKRQVIMQIIKDYGLAVAGESAEEAAQQFTQAEFTRGAKALMNALYDTSFEQQSFANDLAESAEAAIQAGKATAVMAGASSATRVRPELRAWQRDQEAKQLKRGQEVKAQYDAQRMNEVAEAAQSYMQKPSAERATLKKYMQQAKNSSVYQDIYMSADDARAVMISEAVQKNKAALQESGLYDDIERQIEQADQLGTPVRIAFETFGSEIMASQELYAAFKDVIKTYENGITMQELRVEAEQRQQVRNNIEKAAKDNASDYEYAYQYILEQEAAGGIDQQRRGYTAEFLAKVMTYMAKETKQPINEVMAKYAPSFERSFDGSVGGGQTVQDIISTIRKSAQDGEVQNLMKRAGELGKRDARKIAKILGKHLDNAAAGDVQQFMRVVNAIGDMKLNIEAMTDEDIANSLDSYTRSGDVQLNITRDDADRVKSGIFSASEKALSDIQANGQDSDYVVVGGGRIPVQYQIVELNNMITSHDDAGAVNENYPQELQPRDRSRAASDTQIASIVNNFAPERVGQAEIATEGAPIVTPEGYVAVGNGRAMAIRQVYKNAEKAQAYKDYLAGKGYDLNSFEQPVLVRRLAIEMNNEQLKALVDDANTAGTMQYSDSENALRDADKMSGNLLDLLDMEADIDSAANRRFLNAFFAEVVPTAERNAYLDKDDKITRKGVERVENAIVAKLLPEARMLSILVENPDNNIRKVTKELAKAAPAIISFENDIAAGRINADYSIAADVSGAVDLLKRAKDRGVTAAEFIAMRDMFEAPISSSTQNMVQLFEKSSGAADFLNKIRSYIRQAGEQGDMSQDNMFGLQPVSKAELLDQLARQESLFQFAGVKAQTAAMDQLEQAKRLEAQGVDAEQIRQQTGWFKGVDGKYRFEISDKEAEFNTAYNVEDWRKNGTVFTGLNFKLEKILKHDKLFAAYPFLRNVQVEYTNRMPEGVLGNYDNRHIDLAADMDAKKTISVLMHEVQHAIQEYESFARGGNYNTVAEQIAEYKELIRRYNTSADAVELENAIDNYEFIGDVINTIEVSEKPEKVMKKAWYREHVFGTPRGKAAKAFLQEKAQNYIEDLRDKYKAAGNVVYMDYLAILQNGNMNDLKKQYKSIQARIKRLREKAFPKEYTAAHEWIARFEDGKLSSQELYKRLAGEIEARNTQARLNMTEEERKATSPESTQDVKNADAIVVFDDGTAMDYEPKTQRKGHKVHSVFDLRVGDKTAIGDVQEINAENRTIKINDKLHSMLMLDTQIQYKGLTVYDSQEQNEVVDMSEEQTPADVKKATGDLSVIKEQKKHNTEYNKAAIEYFGLTNKLSETGYILTDGNLLDLSGKNFGGSPNIRSLDHRDVLKPLEPWHAKMEEFINSGNIRYLPEGDKLLMSNMPTPAQLKVIERIIDKTGGNITIELMGDANRWGMNKNDFYNEYTNTSFNQVKRDINAFYKGDGVREITRYYQKTPVTNAKIAKLQEGLQQWEKYLAEVVEPNKYGWYADAVEDNRKNAKRKIAQFKKEIKKEQEKAAVPVSEKLYATHNMSLAGVKGALNLGGLAMPSLALRKVSQGNINQFGDIVFVANEKMVEPSRTTDIFDRDAWTPSIANSMRYELLPSGNTFIKNVLAKVGRENELSVFVYNISDNLDTPKSNDMALELYALDKGIELDPYETLHSQEYLDWYDENIMGNSEPYLWTENASNTDMVAKKFTLDNIMKILKKQERAGGGFLGDQVFSARNLLNFMAKKYKNLDEVRKDKHKLVSAEEQNAFFQKIDERFWDLAAELKLEDRDYNYGSDRMGLAVAAINADNGDDVIKKRLAGYYLDTSDAAVAKVKEFSNMMKEVLTDYFEVKPRRAVNFSEFSGVIIPEGKEYDDVAKQLEQEYITVERVKKGDTADYERALMNIQANAETTFFQNQKIDMEALGAYTPAERKITLFRNNNLSTLIHESGHYWLDMLQQFAQLPTASEKLKNDWATVKNWLGVGDDNVITEEQHEKFARGVEKYFLTRKAPSAGLAKIFDTFRRWLVSVYKDVKELDVDLNDDVERVFDHMLASESEIEEYAQAQQFADMMEASTKGLSKADLEKYATLTEQAMTMAKDKHLTDKVALILKEETEAYKEKQQQLKDQVLEEWSKDNTNKAVYILVTGEVPHGHLDIKINTEELRNLLGENFDKYATFGGRPIFADDGISLTDLQEFTGLTKDQVKAALLTARQRMRNFKQALQRRTHEELGDPVTYDDVQKQVIAAYYNDKRAQLLDLDLKSLAGDNAKRQAVSTQGFKKWATDTISRIAIKDLNPEQYSRAMQFAGDKAMAALNHGQRDLAYRFKIQQIRNFVLFREAKDRQAEVESTLRRLKQIGKQEVNHDVDQVYQDAVRALLSRFTLSRALTQKAKERLGNLSAWILEQRSNGYDIVVPADLLEKNNGTSYAELTVDEFLTLGESVKSLVTNGRAIKQFELEGELIERSKLLNEFAAQLRKTYKGRDIQRTGKKHFKGISEMLAPADAAIVMFGDLSNRIDGYDTNGVFHRLFLRPMTESQNRENELLRLYGGKMKELQEALPEWVKKQLFENVAGAKDVLGADYTRGELISIALNMGNLSNLQRLQDGNGFSDEQLAWVAGTLSQEEWDYIQGVWDTLESMYPMLAEHHKKMSGLDMDHVLASPVVTPYGVYKGGYFPLFYDRSAEIEARRNNSLEQALLESDYGRATTSTGYTKQRQNIVKEAVKFDLGLIQRHLASAIHDLAWRGNIRQMWNMANNPEFMATMDGYLHESYRQQLMKLIKDLANSTNREAREMTFAERMARNMRVARTTIGLGFRVKTAVKQLTGFAQSTAIMKRYGHKNKGKHSGAYWLVKGTKAFASDKATREWCLANSGELRTRLNNMDANIAEAMKGVASKQSKLQKIDESIYNAAFWAIGKVDVFTAESTWYGAYLQAINDFGYKHKDAVFYADRVMIESQGSGNLKDKPAMQRKNEWEKMFLMFYSPFSGMYGLWTSVMRDIRDGKERSKALADLAVAMCLPAWLDALVDGDQPDGDDDLAEWLKFFLLRPIMFWASTMPITRDLASYFEFGRAQGFFGDTFKAIADLPKVITSDKWTAGKRVNTVMNATAQIAGTLGYNIPIGGQLADWTQWLTDVAGGNIKIESPMNVIWGVWRGKDGKPKDKK